MTKFNYIISFTALIVSLLSLFVALALPIIKRRRDVKDAEMIKTFEAQRKSHK